MKKLRHSLILCLSLGLNALLTYTLLKEKKKQRQKAVRQTPHPVICGLPALKKIAEECEARLQETDRGKVKLLVYDEEPAYPAILQIGELRISLRRNSTNQSLFDICSFMEALKLANTGYHGTGRYIPVPKEVEFVLSQRHIINVYLKALGLEQISAEDDFWCVDTETGWNTGWKRFDWSVLNAFERLKCKSKIRTPGGRFHNLTTHNEGAKLFLLLKGWEHLFKKV